MIKGLDGSILTERINNEEQVIVESYSGAKIHQLKHYVKPTLLEHKPDRIILHVGTNDLCGNGSDNDISNAILDLAMEINNYGSTPIISSIIARGDRWASKARKVNVLLKQKCAERNICFLDHSNINSGAHLNGSKLHLNRTGTRLLARNIVEQIRKR